VNGISEASIELLRRAGSGIVVRAYGAFFPRFAAPGVLEAPDRDYTLPWTEPLAVPLSPGRHRIRVYLPRFFEPASPAKAEIEVWPGHATDVHYHGTRGGILSAFAGRLVQRQFVRID